MSKDGKSSKTTTITQLVESSGDNVVRNIVSDRANPEQLISSRKNGSTQDENSVAIINRLREQDLLVPGSNISREIQDDYRRIKRPLVSNACGRNKAMVQRGNIILVTSSVPNEGKTYTSANLALSIAQEIDSTVLLIDCDVAKQGISRLLGIEKASGLVDVLEDKGLSVADVILRTDVKNLSVMSAGKQSDYVTELLASQRMSALIGEIASRYSDRIVILDAPPLLPTPQTQVLAGLVGQVVFVVEAGKTPRSLVEEALEMIPEEQAVGLVLNKNQGLSARGGYYYGYYGPEDNEE